MNIIWYIWAGVGVVSAVAMVWGLVTLAVTLCAPSLGDGAVRRVAALITLVIAIVVLVAAQ